MQRGALDAEGGCLTVSFGRACWSRWQERDRKGTGK